MPGLLRGMARTAAVVGTATAVSGNVRHRQDEKYAANDAEAQQAPVPADATTQPSETEQLQELAKMKDQGILTEEEFAAKKKQILGI
jgi:hypothetical protein